jgi:GNAT superfamily N-acetyltransferase
MAAFPPEGLVLEPLDRTHRRKAFSCGSEPVDAWLAHKALGAMEKHTSTTQVLTERTGRIAGYYTLASTALDVSLVPPDMFGGKPPRYAPPTLTLAWLGVDTHFQGRRLGALLLARALADAIAVYEHVRFVAIIVDALSERNVHFYLGQGFSLIPDTADKLYLPARTLLLMVRARGTPR